MSDSDSDGPVPLPPPRTSLGYNQGESVPHLKLRIQELEQEVTALKGKLSTYDVEKSQYEDEIAQLKAQIAVLQSEQAQLKEDLISAQADLSTAQADLVTAQNDLTDAKTQLTTVQNAVKEIQEKTPAVQVPQTASNPATVSVNDESIGSDANIPDDLEILGLKSEIEQLKEQIRRQELLLLESASTRDKPLIVASTGTSINRKPGQVTLKMRKNRQEKVLAVRTQITAWLNKLLSPEPLLQPENLMERLATGVIPCDLAIFVDESAIPILGRVHLKAAPYSILAHENVTSFLRVCYEWGLKKIQCFTPQDLLSSMASNRNERLVVETLLSLSRVVYLKFGIEPPWIVKAEMQIDQTESLETSEGKDAKQLLEDAEHEKLLEAVRAYCALHGIVDIPQPTALKGQFEFSDGTKSHLRMFEIDVDRADGSEGRDNQSVLDAVQNGEIVLLARHNNNWEELHKFLHDHSGGKKVDMISMVQHGAVEGSQTAQLHAGSLTSAETTNAVEKSEEAVVAEKPQVVDIMADTYGALNYEEEDEDDDEDEEYLEQQRLYLAQQEQIRKHEELRAKQRAEEEERARLARLAAEQAESELAARQKALLAQQEQEEEFRRQKQANKYKQSYLTDADLSGDMGELINKVRSRMNDGDFNPQGEDFDPEKANFSHIINTSDFKRFRDVTMAEIQVMTNDDLERLAEYSSKQEFFYLTALAVKMTHELTVSSSFMAVSNQELWRRAIEANIPFHKFHRFVYDEITKSYLEQQSTERQQGKDGANLRNHRELMIANIKERQKQKQGKHYD